MPQPNNVFLNYYNHQRIFPQVYFKLTNSWFKLLFYLWLNECKIKLTVSLKIYCFIKSFYNFLKCKFFKHRNVHISELPELLSCFSLIFNIICGVGIGSWNKVKENKIAHWMSFKMHLINVFISLRYASSICPII